MNVVLFWDGLDKFEDHAVGIGALLAVKEIFLDDIAQDNRDTNIGCNIR